MVSVKNLKKGDLLMKEGDTSNSMYWVQTGSLRLFKKKGNGFIELGMVHSGEVVGEMSFLDNQPRSASVEAVQSCDVIEIPRGKFDEFLSAQPSWMTSLVQTLVKRLRSTNNRVRELENASTVYAKDEEGRTMKVHEFLSTNETLKLSSALLLAAARNSEKNADGSGSKVKAGWLQFYASQVFGVQAAKILAFADVLHDARVIRVEKNVDRHDLHLQDLDRLEKFIYFCHEENSKTEDKQLPLTHKGVAILDGVHEYGGIESAPVGAETFSVNMADVFQKMAAAQGQKIPFEWTSFGEVVKAGLASEVRVSGEEKTSVFQLPRFLKLYPLLSLRQRFRDLNAQKR